MIKKLISIFCKYLIKKNQFESVLLRKLYRRIYNIDVGLYSYGCFDSNRLSAGTVIGRYCSFAPSSYIFRRNHGVNFISLHPYLYNSNLGMIDTDTIKYNPCIIEDDVWFGHNSMILPTVNKVGRGAVIAAGAVVTSDVPRYAIMAGIPAKIIKYRFDEQIIKKIESSHWWEKDKKELQEMIIKNREFVFNPGGCNEKN